MENSKNTTVPNVEQVNNFVALSKINVNGHTEKKGKFTYLSWAFAVAEAMKADPQASWNFRDPMIFSDGTMMVQCDVIMFGKSIYMFLPVMNNMNKAIQNPNAFDVNSAMMRCLVKGIAAHGLGLYIYAGEDLPEEEKQAQQNQNHQQSGQQQKTLDQRYQDALKSIANAKNPSTLDKAIDTFGPTKFNDAIQKACQARADQMGWSPTPPPQNQSQQNNQRHH
ncbi:DUF1071 domain-containing protein [Acinetobacter sp. TY1]|uniref:Sak single strand annealing protein n=1 Tax=Acinetobacter sp. TY1 TaxID=3387626 RepID=UPI003AF8971A